MDEATLGCFAAKQDELRAMAHPSGTGSASDAVCLSCKWTCCALVWRIQRASSLCGGGGSQRLHQGRLRCACSYRMISVSSL